MFSKITAFVKKYFITCVHIACIILAMNITIKTAIYIIKAKQPTIINLNLGERILKECNITKKI